VTAEETRRREAWFGTVDQRQAQKEAANAQQEDEHEARVEAAEPWAAPEDFCAAEQGFCGPKAGFLFQTGPNGVGYYRDRGPSASAVAAPEPSDSSELFAYLDALQGAGGNLESHGSLKLAHLERMNDGLLGRGGQSEVWLYRHPNPPPSFHGELMYGVKIVAKSGLSERRAARVLEEKSALVAAAAEWTRRRTVTVATVGCMPLGPPPIVRLLATDQDANHVYFIQEFLSKGTLTAICPLPPSLVRYYLAALAHAVDLSHRLGFMHRDIKLDNVLLDGDVSELVYFAAAACMSYACSC
jgi:hypothetical protein